jgi:hypothetical protein
MLDFNFDLLQDVLYQDKDYEIAYLSNGSRPGEGWGLGLGSLLP